MFGMRSDPSMFDSPHINVPMKGDITKIDPLVSNNNAGKNDAQREKESREMGNSPAGSSTTEFFSTGSSEKSDGVGYQDSPRMPHMTCPTKDETPNLVFHGLPQARQMDTIFREPQQHTAPAPTSWSNVVSANATPFSPVRLATRSSSGETLLASNMSQTGLAPAPTSFHYLSSRTRSHSFDTESPPHHQVVSKSFSFGNSDNDGNQQQSNSGLGMPPSHPGDSSYKESTLPTIKSGGTLSSTMMYPPSTPYQEFKPRTSSMGSYSPISMGDSMTDQTSPMSSPSLSPHVSPGLQSRKHHGDNGPPHTWQLSDIGTEYHSEPSSPHHRLHSHMPQSIPEHHRHEQGHHSYLSHHHGPTSPPRHSLHSPSSGSPHHHYNGHPSMYPRGRPGPGSSQTPSHHRSSTEVLKTLLRKKACLYEPETSFAVSLVTWLTGRRLALSQGYFTRQHLQAGVHSCVAGKIEEGHVTRTKVNRCMQVILNSCFHYIIPRPDGSEECGQAFRTMFVQEAADEKHLLGTLPPPWNGLHLPSVTEEDSHSCLFHDSDNEDGDHHPHPSPAKPPAGNKESSTASQAGTDSLDSGGKRSVLLCFNENIRSAADVFRCHNEFIRDVAHTGNLQLSSEEWQAFFSGTKTYRKRGAVPAAADTSNYFHLANMHDRMDQHGLSKLRTSWCAKRYDHDHSFCAFAHVDVNRGWLRRDPFVYNYKPIMCPYIRPLQDAEVCYVNMCPLGVRCNHSHSREEILYHPESYKRQPCRNATGSCPLGDICPNAHAEMMPSHHQSHGYNRQGKRHYHHDYYGRASHHPGSKRRTSTSTGHSAGFDKLPDGSPMLYIDPAPLSEFEKTLLLPGLQAIFRDHSSSIFYSTLGNSSPYEYGSFGYSNTQQQMGAKHTLTKVIGKPTRY